MCEQHQKWNQQRVLFTTYPKDEFNMLLKYINFLCFIWLSGVKLSLQFVERSVRIGRTRFVRVYL